MIKRVKITRGSSNVFRDVGFASGEAHNLLLRSELMTRIEQFVKRGGPDAERFCACTGRHSAAPE